MKQTTDKAIARGFRVFIGALAVLQLASFYGSIRLDGMYLSSNPLTWLRNDSTVPHPATPPAPASPATPAGTAGTTISPATTPEFKAEVEVVKSLVESAETAQRLYRLTRDPKSLEAARMAPALVDGRFALLRKMAAGDRDCVAKLDGWERLVRARVAGATDWGRRPPPRGATRPPSPAAPRLPPPHARPRRPEPSPAGTAPRAPHRRRRVRMPATGQPAPCPPPPVGRGWPARRVTFLDLLVLVLATSWFRRFINRRLREEKALRHSESFARATVDALPTSIAILDGYGEMLSTNRAWRDFALAYRAGAKLICAETAGGEPGSAGATRVNYLAVCDELSARRMADAGAFAAGIRAVAEGHRDEFGIEYEWRPSDGGGVVTPPAGQAGAEGPKVEDSAGRRWFAARVTRFRGEKAAGEPTKGLLGNLPRSGTARLVVSHEEITPRKCVEEELHKAKEAAELANLSKSAFLANTSHEIRTPMAAIMGFAEMLLDPHQTPEERYNCCRTIRRNGEHLLAIINDILDISKIEAQKVTVEKIDSNLPQLITDVIGLTRPWAMKKGLTFDVVFDAIVPKQIRTDPLRAKQVLVNLVSNAIKFTQGGTVRLSVVREVTYFGHIISFHVSDTGIGMTAEQMTKLFQPFTQADASTTRKFGGTGLGLTISRRLVKLLGGDITVTSEPGVGSTFTFTLDGGPRNGVELLENFTADQLATADDSEQLQDVKLTGRILLAEDGEDNQDLISTHLRRAGADVSIAGNGRLAVESATAAHQAGPNHRFDLILMDMQMPELDGYGAARQLRAAGLDLPIVALTANAMAEDRVKCLEAGCTDYLSKPIGRSLLLMTVGRYLQQSRAQQAQLAAEGPEGAAANDARSQAEPLRSSFVAEPRVRKLLERFVARLPERVSAMESLLRKQSLEELRHALHQLKGAGGGYGFSTISDRAGEAERLIRDEAAFDSIQQEVQSLISLVRSVDGYDRKKESGAEKREGAAA